MAPGLQEKPCSGPAAWSQSTHVFELQLLNMALLGVLTSNVLSHNQPLESTLNLQSALKKSA